MKNLKMLLVIAILAVSQVGIASTEPNKDREPETISQQVARLLDKPAFQVANEITANVTLMVNKNQELVVLDVDSEDEKIQEFIKDRLNYQKVILTTGQKTFEVPVRVVPAS